MKILVTGGAGYIGSILVPNLLNDGHEVTIYDNFSWGIKPIMHFAGNPNLKIVTGDIRHKNEISKEINKNDAVIHLAAIVGFPACAVEPMRAESTNIEGTSNIVSSMSKNQRLIFASTGSTYGSVKSIATEQTPIAPLTLYGSTKAESEKISMDFGNSIALRFATVFGISPRLRIDLLVNDFTYLAIHKKEIVLFEGENRRTFMHVRDAAKSIKFSLDNFDNNKNNTYNVGNKELNLTKKQVLLFLKNKINFYLHEANIANDPDKRDYEVSYDKIYASGFNCDVSLDQGVDELIKVLSHIYMQNEWRNH